MELFHVSAGAGSVAWCGVAVGAVNQLLAAAPHAQVIHSKLANSLSLNDICDRMPVAIGVEPLDTGDRKLRFIATPRLPHNWESGLWFDETSATLLAGDLFAHGGNGPALTEYDIVGRRSPPTGSQAPPL